MPDKLKIAVSACLLGQKVRYDGKEKKHALIVEVFLQQFANIANNVELIPFCPEVAIGLGVPRPKIQLMKLSSGNKSEQIRVLGVNNHTLDVTDALKSYAQTFLLQYPDLSALIVKSKSPSCGFRSTPLFTVQENDQTEQQYEQIELSSGFFVQSLLILKPEIKIIEEADLKNESDCLTLLNSLMTCLKNR
ncbi:DUF523 domain-containing protein [sulfur-oxidizing endosymbiont of Gigantopelta aegis]|uniref:DUF523 domain-containing protein n=1 Tax=sulfur-oxidizing endosymbiont of Gigantopelta aegis TaxID=2794934 RepID=UPI0018DB6C37|nr:DUF523 domain-containing protein [sulfur-oxidizing endosymbiont of Gigantopelta aegis]